MLIIIVVGGGELVVVNGVVVAVVVDVELLFLVGCDGDDVSFLFVGCC